MARARFRISLLLLAALQSTWAIPAGAQTSNVQASNMAPGSAVVVNMKVYVGNADDGSPIPDVLVLYEETGESCYLGMAKGAHWSTNERTNSAGIAEFHFVSCRGTAVLRVPYATNFEAGALGITLVPGQPATLVRVLLQPKSTRKPVGRTLHIRVQGRLANGTLVPVHFATIRDRQDRRVVTTDYNGNATATVLEAMGETVTLKAEGSHWRDATASFIVGASQGGTNFTRVDDYVTFVLNGEAEAQTEQLEVAIRVRGKSNTKSGWKTVHFASLYDAAGHHLATTNYAGTATVKVKATLGEPYVVKVDATHWKPASESVIAGSIGGGGTTMYGHLDFLLEPEVEAKQLTVEVLNKETDKPVAAAAVTLYKPTGFPGTAVGHATTNAQGLATFSAEEIDSALLNGEARVGAAHGGSQPAIQTIAGSLLQGSSPKYLVYLSGKSEKTAWSGTWADGPYTMQLSGGTGSLGWTQLRHDVAIPCEGCKDLIDQGGGNCTVQGTVATCQWQMHYQDAAKDVERTGHGTITYVAGRTPSDDVLNVRFTQDTGTIKLTTGVCPDINQCTSMHPGAISTGTWKRKKL